MQLSGGTDNLTLLAGVGKNRRLFGSQFGGLVRGKFYARLRSCFGGPQLRRRVIRNGLCFHPSGAGKWFMRLRAPGGTNRTRHLVRASRVVLNDDRYLIGVQEKEEGILIDDTVIFGDDCTAAAGSEDALLRWALAKNPCFSSSFCSRGWCQRSSEALFKTWQPKLRSFSLFVGASANAMTADYYLMIIEEEHARGRFPEGCEMRVGDMGKAMDLAGERGEIVRPVICAVAAERVDPELVFQATAGFIARPETLEEQSSKIVG